MKNFSVWSRRRLEPPFLAGAGADPILSEPEWLQDLGLPELEPPKKVGAPQHWSSVCFALSWEGI